MPWLALRSVSLRFFPGCVSPKPAELYVMGRNTRMAQTVLSRKPLRPLPYREADEIRWRNKKLYFVIVPLTNNTRRIRLKTKCFSHWSAKCRCAHRMSKITAKHREDDRAAFLVDRHGIEPPKLTPCWLLRRRFPHCQVT